MRNAWYSYSNIQQIVYTDRNRFIFIFTLFLAPFEIFIISTTKVLRILSIFFLFNVVIYCLNKEKIEKVTFTKGILSLSV